MSFLVPLISNKETLGKDIITSVVLEYIELSSNAHTIGLKYIFVSLTKCLISLISNRLTLGICIIIWLNLESIEPSSNA